MATGKRFYWIKLRESFFTDPDNEDAIDFLMRQKNGSQYIVLYFMLCLMTANTGGVMANTVGEVIIPYDPERIQSKCRWFSLDTIIVALELYKRLGWVYQQEDGILRIIDFDGMVGSETDWAQKKAKQRALGGDNVPEVSPPMSPELSPKRIDDRDKSTETRDIQSITLTAPACAQEKEANLTENEGELSPEEQKRRLQQTYLGGDLGEGLVLISMEQFDALCEQLSHEELEKYFKIVVDCEKRGKSWKKKTHYQAILDMVDQDRRV